MPSSSVFASLILSLSCSVMSQSSNSSPAASGNGSGMSMGAGAGTSSGSPSTASLAASLSTSCQASAGSLITGDFGQCSNIIGLVNVIGAAGSIIPPLNTWITGVCSATPCSEATLSSAAQTVNQGCSADVQKGSGMASALISIISNYNAVKNVICTQYTSNSTFCVPSILGNIQAASGQNITLSEVVSLMSGGVGASAQAFANVPSSAYCNDCGHALITQSAALMTASGPGSNASSASSSASNICGPSFNDGKMPSTVRVASKDGAAANAKNSAANRELPALMNVAMVSLAFAALLQVVC